MLLVLLAAEGFTILRIGRLLTLHFFLGMLLRVLRPVNVVLTACVFGTGIMLAVTGRSYAGPTEWLQLELGG